MTFPGRARFWAEAALVGYRIDERESDFFAECILQITSSQRLFGTVPFDELWSSKPPDVAASEHKLVLNDDANRSYFADDAEIHCEYWQSHTISDYFHFEVETAPVIRVVLPYPLHPLDWLDQWVVPLAELISFATMEAQSVSWVMLKDRDKTDEFVPEYQLYASPVAQKPFAPKRDTTSDHVALFSFSEPPAPQVLIDRWRLLQQDSSGTVTPFMDALTNPRLHIRSRFLQLVQALEGLHRDEYGDGPRPAEEHKRIRADVLSKIRDSGCLERAEYKWMQRWLDRNGRYSLQNRLDRLYRDLPPSLAELFKSDFEAEDIPVIRNHLSHGTQVYDNSLLSSRARAIQTTALVYILRRMGLPTQRLEKLVEQP